MSDTEYRKGHVHGFNQGRNGDFSRLRGEHSEHYRAGHEQGLTQAHNTGALEKLGAGKPYGHKE